MRPALLAASLLLASAGAGAEGSPLALLDRGLRALYLLPPLALTGAESASWARAQELSLADRLTAAAANAQGTLAAVMQGAADLLKTQAALVADPTDAATWTKVADGQRHLGRLLVAMEGRNGQLPVTPSQVTAPRAIKVRAPVAWWLPDHQLVVLGALENRGNRSFSSRRLTVEVTLFDPVGNPLDQGSASLSTGRLRPGQWALFEFIEAVPTTAAATESFSITVAGTL